MLKVSFFFFPLFILIRWLGIGLKFCFVPDDDGCLSFLFMYCLSSERLLNIIVYLYSFIGVNSIIICMKV